MRATGCFNVLRCWFPERSTLRYDTQFSADSVHTEGKTQTTRRRRASPRPHPSPFSRCKGHCLRLGQADSCAPARARATRAWPALGPAQPGKDGAGVRLRHEGGSGVTARRPGRGLTSLRPGDDRLWVALGLALEVHGLPFDHSSVLRGHSELRKSCRRRNVGNAASKRQLC